jgi:hypothetical protein
MGFLWFLFHPKRGLLSSSLLDHRAPPSAMGFFPPKALQKFFERLFFSTVTEALSELTLTEETRRCSACSASNLSVTWGCVSSHSEKPDISDSFGQSEMLQKAFGSSILTGTI